MIPIDITTDEKSLVEQAQTGDCSAFGKLVFLHYPAVVRVVYRFCCDVSMAEDITQETFLRAWLNLPKFHLKSSLRNWLYRIAMNTAIDILRHKREETIGNDVIQALPDHTFEPEAIMIEKEATEALHHALKSLPHAARSVLVLREYGGLSYQEIADILEVPIGTVMSRLNYARGRLREILKYQISQMENEYA